MAYTKHTWQCGESISADLLNHMEQGIEDASGGGDAGYSCEESYTTLFDGSVTTTQDGDIARNTDVQLTTVPSPLPTSIRVTFNGTQYYAEAIVGEFGNVYGADVNISDWSTFPFSLDIDTYGYCIFSTENADTYTLKIESADISVETTECFRKAVESATPQAESELAIAHTDFNGLTYSDIDVDVFDFTLASNDDKLPILMVSIPHSPTSYKVPYSFCGKHDTDALNNYDGWIFATAWISSFSQASQYLLVKKNGSVEPFAP